MACDYWREQGVLDAINVHLVVATPKVFGMPDVDAELERKIAEYGITLLPSSTLGSVDAGSRSLRLDGPTGPREITYDMLHAEPRQSAPDWLKATGLPAPGDDGGFVEVNDATLRHRRCANVWYRPMPTYPWLRMARERRWQRVMDRHVFPHIYSHVILKGRA